MWMREQGLRWHLMTEIEERGAEAVIADAIAEALDGPELIYLSVDIDVIDPGMAPARARPSRAGC
jgi:agmatinase